MPAIGTKSRRKTQVDPPSAPASAVTLPAPPPVEVPGSEPLLMTTVFNPWPEAKTGECAGIPWCANPGLTSMPWFVANHVAGPPGCPGGELGPLGLRQLGAGLTQADVDAVMRDGVRAAVLHADAHGLKVTDDMRALARAVIESQAKATIDSQAVPRAQDKPEASLRNPEPGEKFDPLKHRAQNRPSGEAFADAEGLHKRIEGLDPSLKE